MSTDHNLPEGTEPEGAGPEGAGPAAHEPSPPWPDAAQPAMAAAGLGVVPGRRRRRRHHRLAGVVVGVTVLGVAAASGSALAAHNEKSLTTAQISAKVAPGLVDVTSTLGYAHAGAAGTGMVLTPSGLVLTNNHVVEGATALKATDIGNGRTYRAVVVGYDRTHDIALIRLVGATGLKTVTLGDSTKVEAGQRVVALGNAGGRGGKPSVAVGRVIDLGQSITANDASAGTSERLAGLIHTNAPIEPGDSGGPLVNTAGQVIAINTAASGPQFRFSSPHPQTQAFAIPVRQAKAILGLIQAGHDSATVHIGATAFLGVQIAPAGGPGSATAPGTGADVAGVLPNSPSARAGLKAGDVIVAVGNHRVTSPSSLQSVVGRYHPGDRVTLRWVDQTGLTHAAILTLANGPAG
jgi:S1-C subfamily serine protease